MKIAIVYFTYGKDSRLLLQSLRAVERLRGAYPRHSVDVFVYDDASDPITVSVADVEGLTYEAVDAPRQGNLRGPGFAVAAMAKFKELAEKGYRCIIKLDSDTYLNDLGWVSPLQGEGPCVVGVAGTMDADGWSPLGPAYALSETYVGQVAGAAMSEPGQFELAGLPDDVPEREVVGHLLRRWTTLAAHGQSGRNGLAVEDGSGRLAEADYGRYVKRYAISFKRPSDGRTEEERLQDHEEALANMTRWADLVEAAEAAEEPPAEE